MQFNEFRPMHTTVKHHHKQVYPSLPKGKNFKVVLNNYGINPIKIDEYREQRRDI